MKKLALAVAIVSLGAAALIATAIAKNGGGGGGGFHAQLDGYQEVPMSISTDGHAKLVITRIDRNARTIEYRLRIRDLDGELTPTPGTAIGQAHIHFSQRHTNGGIAAFLCGGGDKPACSETGTITGTIDTGDILALSGQGLEAGNFEELLSAIRAGATYANVHTTLYPGGEIRGQIDHGRHFGDHRRKGKDD